MKKLRLLAMLTIVVIVGANHQLVLEGFDTGQCCAEFNNHCSDFCELNGHGGMLTTDCYGMTCTEYCFCWDNEIHDHPGGTYCAPCA